MCMIDQCETTCIVGNLCFQSVFLWKLKLWKLFRKAKLKNVKWDGSWCTIPGVRLQLVFSLSADGSHKQWTSWWLSRQTWKPIYCTRRNASCTQIKFMYSLTCHQTELHYFQPHALFKSGHISRGYCYSFQCPWETLNITNFNIGKWSISLTILYDLCCCCQLAALLTRLQWYYYSWAQLTDIFQHLMKMKRWLSLTLVFTILTL